MTQEHSPSLGTEKQRTNEDTSPEAIVDHGIDKIKSGLQALLGHSTDMQPLTSLTPAEVRASRIVEKRDIPWGRSTVGEYTIRGKAVRLYSNSSDEWFKKLIENYERTLVNGLLIQKEMAEKFGIADAALDSLSPEFGETSIAYMSQDSDMVNMEDLKSEMALLRSVGIDEEDINVHFAGHIFHETMHDGGSLIKQKYPEVFGGRTSFGEYTSIIGQLSLYLLARKAGTYGYDKDRYNRGLQDIQNGKALKNGAIASPNDYNVATYIVWNILQKRLCDAFPEYAGPAVEGKDAVETCKMITHLIPHERDTELVDACKKAVADSTDTHLIATMIDRAT